MRHRNHRYQLGVKKEHRTALVANLAAALFIHSRIQTTLAKAKALRPFAEKVITLAKKAAQSDDRVKKLHYYRLALSKVRNEEAVAILFTKRAQEFVSRNGGYTRIYKLAIPRLGDGAEMAFIELIAADDEGYKKSKKPAKKAAVVPATPEAPAAPAEESPATPVAAETEPAPAPAAAEAPTEPAPAPAAEVASEAK